MARGDTSYVVRKMQDEPRDALDAALEAVDCRGFGVVEDVFSTDQVRDFNTRLEDVYAIQCAKVGGEAALESLSDADIVRCPLAYDEAFLGVALHPVIIEAARRLLGPNVVLTMQNGVINRPDRLQAQTAWHRNLNYQHYVSSRPLAISAMVCLEHFNEDTGGTVFLTGSHKVEKKPSEAMMLAGGETPRASAGSIALFDFMVFHRTGVNTSGRVRRGINHVVGVPILAQVIDIPRMRGAPAPEDPFLAGYLGYRWNPGESVAGWRRNKLAALNGTDPSHPPIAPSRRLATNRYCGDMTQRSAPIYERIASRSLY